MSYQVNFEQPLCQVHQDHADRLSQIEPRYQMAVDQANRGDPEQRAKALAIADGIRALAIAASHRQLEADVAKLEDTKRRIQAVIAADPYDPHTLAELAVHAGYPNAVIVSAQAGGLLLHSPPIEPTRAGDFDLR